MATAFADLIQAGLETADVEKSNNFSATEKARIANESLSAVYDFIVAKWQEYFAAAVTFTLPPANAITLAEITSGIPPAPAYPVASPALGPGVISEPVIAATATSVALAGWSSTINADTTNQYFAVGGSASFSTTRGFIPPGGRILSLRITPNGTWAGIVTTFTVYKNNVATRAKLTVGGGAPGSVVVAANEPSWPAVVHFNGTTDTMDLVAKNASGVGNLFSGEVFFALDQPNTAIYKELGLTRTQTGIPETVTPLPGYSARNDIQDSRRRYWLQGQTLSLWPQFNGIDHSGSYVLDYIPNCPVMVDGDLLPSELERWKELITVVMAIKFLIKRKQSTADMEKRQQHLEQAIVIAASSRKSEARQMRPIYRHDVTPWGTWQNPLYPRR